MAIRKHSAFGLLAGTALVASAAFLACGSLDHKTLHIIDGASGDAGASDNGGSDGGGTNPGGGRAGSSTNGGSAGEVQGEGGEGGEMVPLPGAPTVVSVTPEDGALNVEPDAAIAIEFSDAMDPTTVNENNIVVQDPLGANMPGTVTYSKRIATFSAANRWALLQGYKVLVKAAIANDQGIPLGKNFTSQFAARDGKLGVDAQAAPIQATDQVTGGSSLAGDGHGHGLIVWAQPVAGVDDIRARTFNNGVWSAEIMNVDANDSSDAHQPVVAMNESGDAIVVWAQNDPNTNEAVYARRYIQGVWEPAATHIDTGSVSNQSIDAMSAFVSADGQAHVIWEHDDPLTATFETDARSTLTTTTWGNQETLQGGNVSLSTPALSFDADGNGIALQYPDSADGQVLVHRYSKGAWSKSNITDTNAGLNNLVVVSDGAQGALAIWSRTMGNVSNVVASTFDKTWSTPQSISADVPGSVYSTSLARTPTGYLAAFAKGSVPTIHVTQTIPGGSEWTVPKSLTEDTSFSTHVALATDPYGSALLLWQQNAGMTPNSAAKIYYSRFASGKWSDALRAGSANIDAGSPQLVLSADGTAVMTWSASTALPGGAKLANGFWSNTWM